MMNDPAVEPLAVFRATNVEYYRGTWMFSRSRDLLRIPTAVLMATLVASISS
jgi:hypothetical protein